MSNLRVSMIIRELPPCHQLAFVSINLALLLIEKCAQFALLAIDGLSLITAQEPAPRSRMPEGRVKLALMT
jgi:hypothetical protein